MRKLALLVGVILSCSLTACVNGSSGIKLKDTAMTQMIEQYDGAFADDYYDFIEFDNGVSEKREFLGGDLYFLGGVRNTTGYVFFTSESALKDFLTKLPDYVAQVTKSTTDGEYVGGAIPDWYGIRDNAGKYAGVSNLRPYGNESNNYTLITFDTFQINESTPFTDKAYIDTGCIVRFSVEADSVIGTMLYLGMDFEGEYFMSSVDLALQFAEPYMSSYTMNGYDVHWSAGSRPDGTKVKVKCKWEGNKFSLNCREVGY